MAKTLVIILAAFVAAASASSVYRQQGSGYNKKNSAEEEVEKHVPSLPYEFAFAVNDDNLTNYQQRQETSDGTTISGSYQVVDPDGFIRKVVYTAHPERGFEAKVYREPTDIKIVFPVPKPASAEETTYYSKPSKPQHQQVQYTRPAPPPPRYEPQPAASYPRYAAPAPVVEDDRQRYAAPAQLKPARKTKKQSSQEEDAGSITQGLGTYRVVTATSEQYVDFGSRRAPAPVEQDD